MIYYFQIDPYGDQGNFQGDLNSTGVPHGEGKMSYTDGRIYEGDWKDGKWHGYGKAIFPNQDQYEGGYQDDQRHGQGTYRWNDGRVYTGGFDNDQRHGQGTTERLDDIDVIHETDPKESFLTIPLYLVMFCIWGQ